jgi:hypothetical protein
MPKAILEFSLPEEREEFALAAGAQSFAPVLRDLREAFRAKAKYAEPDTTWTDVYELFWEILKERGIELD